MSALTLAARVKIGDLRAEDERLKKKIDDLEKAKAGVVIENWTMIRYLDYHEALMILKILAELATTLTRLEGLMRTFAADNLKLREVMNIGAGAGSRVHPIDVVERSHQNLKRRRKF